MRLPSVRQNAQSPLVLACCSDNGLQSCVPSRQGKRFRRHGCGGCLGDTEVDFTNGHPPSDVPRTCCAKGPASTRTCMISNNLNGVEWWRLLHGWSAHIPRSYILLLYIVQCLGKFPRQNYVKFFLILTTLQI
jgi:hypothetical protein